MLRMVVFLGRGRKRLRIFFDFRTIDDYIIEVSSLFHWDDEFYPPLHSNEDVGKYPLIVLRRAPNGALRVERGIEWIRRRSSSTEPTSTNCLTRNSAELKSIMGGLPR